MQSDVRDMAPVVARCLPPANGSDLSEINEQETTTLMLAPTTRTKSRPKPHTQTTVQPKRSRFNTFRKQASIGTLVAGVLLAAFCFFRGASAPTELTRSIEDIRPGHKVLVDAPKEALATDIARLNALDATWNAATGELEVDDVSDPLRQLSDASFEQIKSADYRLVIFQGKEVWENGTYNEINVASLQPWQWIHQNEVHVGAFAPMPIDTLELGLPEGATGKVLDILPCPNIETGRGRVVLTTINRLSDTVTELTLRDTTGNEETLRPTEEHLFYSLSHGEWLPAGDLQTGERLDGIDGPVIVAAVTPIEGTRRVYNMTVQGEHLYRVAACGVLVHNTYKKPVVIGEGMDRVMPAAKAEGFGYYKPRDGAKTPISTRNKRWVQRMKREGREIHDVGPRPTTPNPDSMYYDELEWFGDYPLIPLGE